jgi:hypothetical protein
MGTKMILSAKVINDKGEEVICPIYIESNIPNIEDFFDVNKFDSNFNSIETAVLTSRKELSEKIIEEYISESTKKKQLKK